MPNEKPALIVALSRRVLLLGNYISNQATIQVRCLQVIETDTGCQVFLEIVGRLTMWFPSHGAMNNQLPRRHIHRKIFPATNQPTWRDPSLEGRLMPTGKVYYSGLTTFAV
jgi:hypothetical protein